MRIASHRGNRYFIVIIDDSSRCEVRVMKSKSETLEKTREVIAMLEKQKGREVRCLQSDNGTEYVNNKFDEMLKERGITRRLTIPHNPEQNGVAERKNRNLLDTARCLLTELQNRDSLQHSGPKLLIRPRILGTNVHSKVSTAKIPYEKWTGKKPHIGHTRIFGFKIYCLRREPGKGKLEPRGEEGISVEYSDVSKNYRVGLPNKRKVDVSRDIKFIEDLNHEPKE